MLEVINSVMIRFWVQFVNFLPDFVGGLIILIVGLIIAGIVKRILLTVFTFMRLEAVLQRTRLLQKTEVKLWEEIIVEIAKWTIVIIFLVPTLEVWGLSRATLVLNQVLFYLPNVIVAVIVAFVGVIVANLTSALVKNSIKSVGATSANSLGVISRWVVLFFTALVALNQLGVAQDLIRILFTGIVAMLALAGGLAFGLGGRDLAKDILEELRRKVQ